MTRRLFAVDPNARQATSSDREIYKQLCPLAVLCVNFIRLRVYSPSARRFLAKPSPRVPFNRFRRCHELMRIRMRDSVIKVPPLVAVPSGEQSLGMRKRNFRVLAVAVEVRFLDCLSAALD